MGCCGKVCACPMKAQGSCPKENVEITREEKEFLEILEEVLYIPVVDQRESIGVPTLESKYGKTATKIVKELERKGVISVDYDEILNNFDYENEFEDINRKGSISLKTKYLNKIDYSFEEKNKE